MSSISGVGGANPAYTPPSTQAVGQGANKAADTTASSQTSAATTDQTAGAVDAATQALVQPNLSKDQALALSKDASQQLANQTQAIANRQPQALQQAFAA